MRNYLLTIYLLFTCSAAHSNDIEFLNWWTSEGEQRALSTLITQSYTSQGQIISRSIPGEGGQGVMTILQARALASTAPPIAQFSGPSIPAWDTLGLLHSLNKTAEQLDWDNTFYPLIQQVNKTGNGYVALPISLHRLNWLWVNEPVRQQLAIQPPKTWEDFISAMDLALAEGISPLAIGEKPWQIAQLFENILLGVGGKEIFTQSLVKLEPQAINSAEMREALRIFRQVSLRLRNKNKSMAWHMATAQLVKGDALFQIGGDWILGELLAKGVNVPDTVSCYPTPQTEDYFVYNIDSLVFLKNTELTQQSAEALATRLADKQFHLGFNRIKGAIPAYDKERLLGYNVCQQVAKQDFKQSEASQNLIPSVIDSMAVRPLTKQAIMLELFNYFRDPALEDELIINKLLAIAQSYEQT